MTTKNARTIQFGQHAVTGQLDVLMPNGNLTRRELCQVTVELRQRYPSLVRRPGAVVRLQTPLAAFPAALFRIEVCPVPNNRCPLLLLDYAEHLAQQPPQLLPLFGVGVDTERVAFHILRTLPDEPVPLTDLTRIRLPLKRNFAVFTTDRANFHEAANLAADLGVKAQMYFPKDRRPVGDDLAELYDLDHFVFSAAERDALVNQLSRVPLSRPTGLHSYNVCAADQTALEANDVVFARRLGAALIQAVLLGPSAANSAAA
jgi:hypothetical protein